MTSLALETPPSSVRSVTIFRIEAGACPQLLNRLLGLVAQQDRLPDRVAMRRRGAMLSIRIRLPDIDARRAEIIAEKMRSMVAVTRVRAVIDEAAG